VYDLPSARGSSGAPLFDDQWNVVGQHIGYLQIQDNDIVPSRLGIGAPLDSIRLFLSGEENSFDDEVLMRNALMEIAELQQPSNRAWAETKPDGTARTTAPH
jgi:hypothetical protein